MTALHPYRARMRTRASDRTAVTEPPGLSHLQYNARGSACGFKWTVAVLVAPVLEKRSVVYARASFSTRRNAYLFARIRRIERNTKLFGKGAFRGSRECSRERSIRGNFALLAAHVRRIRRIEHRGEIARMGKKW